jgi:hypothetical protein
MGVKMKKIACCRSVLTGLLLMTLVASCRPNYQRHALKAEGASLDDQLAVVLPQELALGSWVSTFLRDEDGLTLRILSHNGAIMTRADDDGRTLLHAARLGRTKFQYIDDDEKVHAEAEVRVVEPDGVLVHEGCLQDDGPLDSVYELTGKAGHYMMVCESTLHGEQLVAGWDV